MKIHIFFYKCQSEQRLSIAQIFWTFMNVSFSVQVFLQERRERTIIIKKPCDDSKQLKVTTMSSPQWLTVKLTSN